MKRKISLRSRIALSYVALALVLGSFFTGVAILAVNFAERYLIDQRLESLATQLIDRHDRGQPIEAPPGTYFYADASIPAHLRSLPDGFQDVFSGTDELHVLVLRHGPQHFVLVDEQREFENLEVLIFFALGAGFAGSLALAVLLGTITARRVIAPVTALADAISRNYPPDALPALASEDEIGMLARAFAARTRELEDFLARERLFTGDVSHELRTPLTIILGAAEVMAARLHDRPDLHAAAERIGRAAADTAERVNALLLLSRAPDEIDAPRIELRALIEREIMRCRPLLLGKPVDCRLDAPDEVWVHARPELAGIAIGNLLANACRYTDAGAVNVRLDSGRIVIQDSGSGIPDAIRARLFERFVHAGGGDLRSGIGLGLSIVKRLTDHLKWDIRLESPAEGGSRFILSFPAGE